MSKVGELAIKTSNNQPVKEISYQDMNNLADTLEQLKAWQEPLHVLEKFFSEKKRPVNKQKIAREYHSCSLLFNVFSADFNNSIQNLEVQIGNLKSRRKV